MSSNTHLITQTHLRTTFEMWDLGDAIEMRNIKMRLVKIRNFTYTGCCFDTKAGCQCPFNLNTVDLLNQLQFLSIDSSSFLFSPTAGEVKGMGKWEDGRPWR